MVPWTQARARPGRSAPLVRFWPVLRIACVQTHRFLVFRNGPSFQARWAFVCVRVGARVHVRVRACVRVFSFPPSPPEPLPCGGRLSRPLLRVVLVEDAFEAASLQAEWGPGCLSAPSKPGGGARVSPLCRSSPRGLLAPRPARLRLCGCRRGSRPRSVSRSLPSLPCAFHYHINKPESCLTRTPHTLC